VGIITKFKPAFKNPHLQTLYSSFFYKEKPLKFEFEHFSLSDGDFIECYWQKNDLKNIVVLLHGLTGSYYSPYIQQTLKELHKRDFSTVTMHYRGTSGKPNLKPRSYHSGNSEDFREYVNHLTKIYPQSNFFAVGFSIGGNILLKYLGEEKNNTPLKAAMSVSAPYDLAMCANRVNRGFSRFYQYILLKELKKMLHQKFNAFAMEQFVKFKKKDIKKLNSFWAFDDAYSAPIHGFGNVHNYYATCSSKHFLKDIAIPTLLLHAKDDPFMTQEVIPKPYEYSKSVKLEVHNYGGHVGFIGGSFFKPKYYVALRVREYFEENLFCNNLDKKL